MNDGQTVNLRDLGKRISDAWPAEQRTDKVNTAIDVLHHVDLAHEAHNGMTGQLALMDLIEDSRKWTAPEADELLRICAVVADVPQNVVDKLRSMETQAEDNEKEKADA